ncbi:TPA: hypothetical protein TUD77_001207 [Streptococcus equi subsp. zooepidemicus]|uniref:hypothetical protein n=1 Tax=Streptococcus equi TaxID=1336 RepID=UPI0005B82760|nr:hypothetical protein [Streptococcus equi]KIS10687.1 hypothetical protein AT51_01159 [Streptococcus equi subsp. zooepidemicus Sz57]MCD3376302.1 hypothetical protein [Streptococcus equi subsp. zooepidemicus]MCD3438176.1 hypothetical protein [Streptococcus equi subsp. zooepidemicus]MDI5916773.1 hypothetical protein [Streptococcus equi subsp. zooepidemicus]QTZ56630.1 hypothetical protein JFMEOBDD_00709 [Streptococcus equi subsp. zooepidemicus]
MKKCWFTTNFEDYVKASSTNELTLLVKNQEINLSEISNFYDVEFEFYTKDRLSITDKGKTVNSESVVIYIGSNLMCRKSVELYASNRKYNFTPYKSANDFLDTEFDKKYAYVTIVCNTDDIDDSIFYKCTNKVNINNIYTSVGFLLYDDIYDLTYQIFKTVSLENTFRDNSLLIAHDDKMKNKNYFNFFDSSKGNFPYTDEMDIFSFHGHSREDKLFIYNGYICNDNNVMEARSGVEIPHWAKNPEYYEGKKDIVDTKEIKCKIAFLNSCSGIHFKKSLYRKEYWISEGFRVSYPAVVIGSNIIKDGSSIENIFFIELIKAGYSVGESVNILNKMSKDLKYDTGSFCILGAPEFRLTTLNSSSEKILYEIKEFTENLLILKNRLKKYLEIFHKQKQIDIYGVKDKRIQNIQINVDNQLQSLMRKINISNIHRYNLGQLNHEMDVLESQLTDLQNRIISDLSMKTRTGNYLFSEYYHELSEIDYEEFRENSCPNCNNSILLQKFTVLPENVSRFVYKCSRCGTSIDLPWNIFRDINLKIEINKEKLEIKVLLDYQNLIKKGEFAAVDCEILEADRYLIERVVANNQDSLHGETIFKYNFQKTPLQVYYLKVYIMLNGELLHRSIPINL